jgi:hypothetical protein
MGRDRERGYRHIDNAPEPVGPSGIGDGYRAPQALNFAGYEPCRRGLGEAADDSEY